MTDAIAAEHGKKLHFIYVPVDDPSRAFNSQLIHAVARNASIAASPAHIEGGDA